LPQETDDDDDDKDNMLEESVSVQVCNRISQEVRLPIGWSVAFSF
jgi:hypothetical protein